MSYPPLHHSRLRLANWVERVSARLMHWLRQEERVQELRIYNNGCGEWVLADHRGPIYFTETLEEARALMKYKPRVTRFGRQNSSDG